MKAIETFYNGRRFRSRAEARWAVLMDAAGIKYAYEPEGFKFYDGTCYLPDFYLEDQKTFLEVKGVFDDDSIHKVTLLAKETGKKIVIGYENLKFDIFDWIPELEWYAEEKAFKETGKFELERLDDPWLCKCAKCGKTFFKDGCGSWACECCGHYDGDAGFRILCRGDEGPYYYENKNFLPLRIALAARFEHGEHGLKQIGEIMYGI